MRVRAATASRMHAATTDIVASAFAPARRLHGAHTASCYSAAAAVTCGRLCILLSRAPLLPLFQTVFRSATTLARPPTPSHRTRESSAGRTLFRPHSYPQNRSPSPIVRERVRVNPLDAASAPFGGVSKDGVGNVSELPDKSDLSKPQLPPDCVPALRQQSQDQIHIVAIARQGHKHQPHEQHQWEQQPQQQQQQHEVAPYNHADEAQEKNEAVAKASNEGDFRMNDMAPGLVLRKESMLGSRTDTAGVTTPKAMSPVALSSLMVDEMAPSEFEDIPEMDQRDVAMSQEQSFLLDTMMSGRSVYFTGKAGSGKTAVIHRFIEDARKKGKIVGVTAPTGLAASHIGGTTLHAYFGLRVSNREHENSSRKLVERAKNDQFLKKRYKSLEVLVIDEVSMVRRDDFFAIHLALCEMRQTPESMPFGGVQVILSGDFFQLPPIVKTPADDITWAGHSLIPSKGGRANRTYAEPTAASRPLDAPGTRKRAIGESLAEFVFMSTAWDRLLASGMSVIELSQSYRHGDPEFINLLDSLRVGELTEESSLILKDCVHRELPTLDGVEPTKLCTYRRSAEAYNTSKLERLVGSEQTFECMDSVFGDSVDHLTDEQRGDVMQSLRPFFSSLPVEPVLTLRKGAQVMLTQNRSIKDGLVNGARGVITGFRRVRDRVTNSTISLPIVHFADGRANGSFVIGYRQFDHEVEEGVWVRRTQLPLKLAWGLTIHKSQGMTLNRAIVDFGSGTFQEGQAYVALSRLKSLSGLSLTSQFHKGLVKASPNVMNFYANLPRSRLTNE